MRRPTKSVTPRGFKKLACKYCGSICDRVDSKADAITCFRCVNKMLRGEVLDLPNDYTLNKTKKKSKK